MAKREQNCKWYFADQPLGGQDVGPNNAMAQNFKKHPYASLVRESIQNSLDAVADKSKPVRVVYSFKNMRWADYPEFYKIKGLYRYCPWMRGMATSQISCNNGIDKKASHVPL